MPRAVMSRHPARCRLRDALREALRNALRGPLLAAALAAAPPMTGVLRAAEPGPRPQVVYGSDDRREVFGLSGAKAAAAASTVALVDAWRLTRSGSSSRLSTMRLSASEGLCPGERFAGQPTAAFCSGVLVGPDLVATAGHCVENAAALSATRFVFGFRLTAPSTPRTTIPNGDIYRGVQVVGRQLSASGADFAVVRLDRRVTGRTPQRISRVGPPANGTPLYVIGHPSGLPTKIAAGARVARSNQVFFEANLDTFGGNSGSPVFDGNTNTVVGILVRGADDYRPQGSCNVVNVLPNSTASEDATNTRLFAGFVPRP